jgi:hypothetical protein
MTVENMHALTIAMLEYFYCMITVCRGNELSVITMFYDEFYKHLMINCLYPFGEIDMAIVESTISGWSGISLDSC